jgi:hypothetical protein
MKIFSKSPRVLRATNARAIVALLAIGALITGLLAACGAQVDEFDQAFNGYAATMRTFDDSGNLIDRVKGESFRVARDTEFDTLNSDGTSKNDSSVLLISLGDSHIHHVGATMILAQDGLTDISASLPSTAMDFTNTQPGTPWLNDLRYRFKNAWGGSSKTIVIRSQNGRPIAVYGGNDVQILSTDVPKSTWFRIDGKTLFFYRGGYTVYDNKLLKR